MAKDPYAFVKSTGRDKYFKSAKKELLDLIDPETNELKKNLSRWVNCVACESDQHNYVFSKDGFRFVKCCKCGLLFVNPQLDESKLISSYQEDESHSDWIDVLLSPAQQEYDAKHRFGKALEQLGEMYPAEKRGRILDVGCSIGLFLDCARKMGWDPYGMEINPKAVAHARDHYNLPVEEKLLHEVDYPKKHFQIVSMWGVLEHIANPDVILDQISPLMEDDGTLVILVPNGHSLAVRIMHEHSPTVGGRNHLWYFSPETLGKLLERKGFELTSYYTQLMQIEELTQFLRYNNPYIPDKEVEFEEFSMPDALKQQLEDYLQKNNLGYKLIAFARKKK